MQGKTAFSPPESIFLILTLVPGTALLSRFALVWTQATPFLNARRPSLSDTMIIFTRTFDFLTWLLPITNHFPSTHRFTFTQRLLDAAFNFYEHIETANHRRGQERTTHLRLADEELDKVRIYLRLATKWGWLSGGQYQHVAQMVAEIGKLLGGWKKAPPPQPLEAPPLPPKASEGFKKKALPKPSEV